MAGYATSTSNSISGYGDCVASLRTSLNFLESSVATLDNGVADYPRLASVLKTVRVSGLRAYRLTSNTDIKVQALRTNPPINPCRR
jgi:hypothetical protein